VTVRWTGPSGGPGPDLLKGKYAAPKNPVARVTVAQGENVLDAVRLESLEAGPKGEPKEER
jgi:hypothetical protein